MNENTIRSAVIPVLAAHQLELDRLEIVPAGRRKVVRITVDGDGPQGRGPLLDDIAAATRDISEALDAADLGNQPYTLEVSSRGVGRPLTEGKHFRRNATRLVKITTAAGEQFTGRIVSATDAGVRLDVDGAEREVAVGDIAKAVVEVELNRPKSFADDAADDLDDADDADDTDDEEI